jgi:DNA-binding CsgD family transcriptional regulator
MQMVSNRFSQGAPPELPPASVPSTRIGDLAAMLRVMQPLHESLPDRANSRRQLLADLCRFIGVKVGSLPADALWAKIEPASSGEPEPASRAAAGPAGRELSPRQQQTLLYLLDGNSEKQVARRMKLSQHTVHVYVKALYRRFGVSSRAELLAMHFKR